MEIYNSLANSKIASKISSFDGDLKRGFLAEGVDCSLVNSFEFQKNSAKYYDFVDVSNHSLVGSVNFIGNNLLGLEGVRYKLVDKEIGANNMNILYVMKVDDSDFEDSPCPNFAPYFSFPKKVNEIGEFFIKRGMDKDLVSRLQADIEMIRSAM